MAKVTVALACPGLRWRKWRHLTHPCHHVIEYHLNRSKIIHLSFKIQKICACGAISSYIQVYPAVARHEVYIHSYIHSF